MLFLLISYVSLCCLNVYIMAALWASRSVKGPSCNSLAHLMWALVVIDTNLSKLKGCSLLTQPFSYQDCIVLIYSSLNCISVHCITHVLQTGFIDPPPSFLFIPDNLESAPTSLEPALRVHSHIIPEVTHLVVSSSSLYWVSYLFLV